MSTGAYVHSEGGGDRRPVDPPERSGVNQVVTPLSRTSPSQCQAGARVASWDVKQVLERTVSSVNLRFTPLAQDAPQVGAHYVPTTVGTDGH